MINNTSPLTAGQVRAARGFLRWTAAELAEKSGLGVATIQRAETAVDVPSMTRANLDAVRRAFESAGIEFLEDDAGFSVRLVRPPS